jgi:hypothetical protein
LPAEKTGDTSATVNASAIFALTQLPRPSFEEPSVIIVISFFAIATTKSEPVGRKIPFFLSA